MYFYYYIYILPIRTPQYISGVHVAPTSEIHTTAGREIITKAGKPLYNDMMPIYKIS